MLSFLDASDFMIPQDNTYYFTFNYNRTCINVQAVPDNIVEMNETFSISLSFDNPLDSVEGVQEVTITIIDDDGNDSLLKFCILIIVTM